MRCKRMRQRLLALLLFSSVLLSQGPAARAAAEVVAFTATPRTDGSVLITWETATELDTAAFRVLRDVTPSGPFATQVGDQIGAKTGDVTGAEYEVLDTTAVTGVTYYYLLEEIEKNGNINRLTNLMRSVVAGVLTTPTATLTATPSRTATSTATRTATPTPTRTATPTIAQGATDPPTATRRFTNTPELPATATPSATASPSARPPSGTGTATATARPTQIATIRATPSPTLGSGGAAQQTSTGTAPASPTKPAPAATGPAAAQRSPTPAPVVTPLIFTPKETPAVVIGRPQPTPLAPAGERRDTGQLWLLGGGAMGLAALLAVGAWWVWRARRP